MQMTTITENPANPNAALEELAAEIAQAKRDFGVDGITPTHTWLIGYMVAVHGMRGTPPEDFKYGSYYELILREGKQYASPKRARPYGSGIRKRKDRECYNNSVEVSVQYDLTYVEGIAYRPGLIPVEHAWCVDADDNVIDPTWSKPGSAYIGVPMDTEAVWARVVEQKYYGIFASDWVNDFRCLKEGIETLKKGS